MTRPVTETTGRSEKCSIRGRVCAYPRSCPGRLGRPYPGVAGILTAKVPHAFWSALGRGWRARTAARGSRTDRAVLAAGAARTWRAEERRVGQECRSRG